MPKKRVSRRVRKDHRARVDDVRSRRSLQSCAFCGGRSRRACDCLLRGLNDWRVSYPVVIVIFRTLTTQKNDLSQIACSGLAASVIWR